ncbi:ubiquitin carboxyl-terminal hydrolase 16 isoform X2 [Lepisosteus oculatus]|uniref:ubiquitin carboxyl-terminal hydrolase 16 isoform X2 n=1 Tax=Lepisosteus oculatus TaxID=7918 RepID=UPI0037153078
MGKKRAKEKHLRDEDPVDVTGPNCRHIRKGIDSSLLKKTVQDVNWNACQDCKGEEIPASTSAEENSEGPGIWFCLKCGHRGCGRHSENQHAFKHYEKPHSDPHCLVLSPDTWSVWCYMCDDEVQYSRTGQLAQLVNNIRKQALSEMTKKTLTKIIDLEIPKETLNDTTSEENKNGQKKDTKADIAGKKEEKLSLKKAPQTNSNSLAVKGLSNLGNTCFFNAVLQNLSQTQFLRQLLNEMKDEKTTLQITPHLSSQLEPLVINLDRPGSLTLAMCQVLNEIQETKKGVVTPKELFSQVCKKAARFKGFQQQDSQELLRYLLDGMKAEEMKRVSSGILEALNNSGKLIEAEESKKLVKEYEKNGAPRNFVDQVFGGELTSTVMCKECKTVSLVTEMFLDLSLPVSDEAYRKKSTKKVVRRTSDNEEGDSKKTSVSPAEIEELPSGSKYQQKKAKKQAKKQAKIQRRQQKQAGKLGLGSTSSQDIEHVNGDESAAQEEIDQSELGATTQGEACLESSEPNNAPPSNSQNSKQPDHCDEETHSGEEAQPEDCEPSESCSDNRFKALDNKEGLGEDELVKDMNSLTINEDFISPDDIDFEIDSCGDAVDTKAYTVVDQDPELAFTTLADREAPGKQDCSVQSCLYQFTEVEHLTTNNSLQCVTCTQHKNKGSRSSSDGEKCVYTDALKQMLISLPPPVLTLHLKRFQQVGYSVCKVNRHVIFPQVLDLAPFCTTNCKNVPEGEKKVLYRLYGIVEHSGTMRSGHYTAYVKVRPNNCLTNQLNGLTPQASDSESVKGSWFHISDTSVQAVPETKVLNSQAYLLFYERIL